jgi:outer membrane protein TolC
VTPRQHRLCTLLMLALVVGPSPSLSPAAERPDDAPRPLGVAEVLDSVERHYPLLLAAQQERELAAGKLQSARGGFDVGFSTKAITAPSGFYQNERLDLLFEQPLRPWGAEVRGGYRIGQGDFAVYDGGLKTNRDGELRLGARLPLLRDRAIDERRAKLRSAEIGIEQAEPVILEQRLEARRLAELAYWEWVSAGEKNRIALSLLRLADDRQESLEAAADEGLIAEIVLVDNQRLIAQRRAILVDTERRLQQAAIELSLYLRDLGGSPVIPEPGRLPSGFPPLAAPGVRLEADLERAWEARPELRQLLLEQENQAIRIARSKNKTLPGIELAVSASKDLGDAVNTPDDKGELELKTGVVIELPLQRRGARGELRAELARRERLDQRLQFLRDTIGVQVRDAHSAWVQAFLRFEQAARSVELARELEAAERIQVTEGNSDLLRLNIREQQTAQAASFLVDVKTEFFEARSNYRAAIAELNPAADPAGS